MWVYDLKTLAFLEVNDAAVEKYGYSRAEFLRMTIKDIRPAEEVSRLEKDVKKKRPTLQHSGQWKHKLRDGRVIDVEITSHTLEYNGRKAALVTAQDVTERTQAEEKLRVSDERFAKAFRTSPTGLIISRMADGKLLEFNDRFLELFGYQREEVAGRTSLELNLYADPKDRQKSVNLLKKHGSIRQLELSGRRKNGDIILIDLSAEMITVGDEACLLAIINDITKRKHAEAALHHNRDLLLALSRAAQSVQRARTPDEVYRAVGEKIKALGFELFIFTLDDLRQNLTLTHATYAPRLLRTTEKLTGIATSGYQFPLNPEGIFRRVLAEEKAEFIHWTGDEAAKVLPKNLRPLAEKVVTMLKIGHGILAPLRTDDELMGILAVTGSKLEEDDVPAMDAFANQVAISLRNAQLAQQVRDELAERKQAIGALQESEGRFAALFRNNPAAFAITRLSDGLFVEVNQTWQEMTGYSRDEVIGHTPLTLNLWTDPAQRARLIETVQKRGKTRTEIQIRQKSGEIRDLLLSAETIHLAGEHYLITMAQDLTERKQAERSLREEEERYHDLVENISDLICTHDLEGRILSVNRAAITLTGYSADELIGKNLRDFFSSEARQTFDAYLTAIQKNSSASGLMTILTKSGERRIWEYRNTLRAEGVPNPIVRGYARDITERRQAEKELNERETRYHNLFEDSPVSLWEEDFSAVKQRLDELKAEGVTDFRAYFASHPDIVAECISLVKVLDVNKATLELYEASSKEELLGNLGRFFVDMTYKNFTEELLNMAAGMTEFSWTGTNQTLNGKQIDVNLQWSVMPGHEQTLDSVIVSLMDITERKQAEAERATLQDMIERSRNEIFVFNAETLRFQYVNGGALRNLGYTLEQMSAFTPLNIKPEYTEASFRTLIQPLLIHETERLAFETIHRRANGSTYPVEVFLQLIQTGDKELFLAVINDITHRKEAERKLQESESTYRTLIEQIPAIVYLDLLDGKGTTLFVSPQVEALLGVPVDEWLQQGVSIWAGLIHPEDRQKALQAYQSLAIVGQGYDIEYRMNSRHGPMIWIHDTGIVRQREDGQFLLQGVMYDITTSKKADEKLRESEARFRGYFELSLVGFAISSSTTHWMDANPTLCDMLGYTKDELIQKTWKEITHPDDIPVNMEKFNQALNGEIDNYSLEKRFIRKDGSLIHVAMAAHCLRRPDRTVDYIMSVFLDITEHKQVEEKIRQLNSELEQRVEERTRELRETQEQLIQQEKLAVLGKLASGVGHELRNPLAIINNAVYFLRLIQPEAGQKIKDYHTIIENETRTAEKIITDLLDFARIKSVDRELVSASELVERTLGRFPVPASVELSLEVSTSLPKIFVDTRQMEQVLGNLITNACQAMKDGGQLSVISDQLSVSGEQWIRIAVRDNGMGIPPENMKRLFEPLFTTKLKGIGLGLAVSKKLAEANRGRIEVQSEAGVGSTFTLWLPIHQERES